MDDLVNKLAIIQREIQGSGVTLKLENGYLQVARPGADAGTRLTVVHLYRPSSHDVEAAAAPDNILVLNSATERAAKAAEPYNHVLIPGGYRITAPGVALIHPATSKAESSRQVRLTGRTGIVAETLLLGGNRPWSVRELASASQVSPGLAHRVVARLERTELLSARSSGPEKSRVITNPAALAELWAQEERLPERPLRGFLYGASNEAIARKLMETFPGSAIGGIMAANAYRPVLTRVNPPIRLWAPQSVDLGLLPVTGFELTSEGANVEYLQAKDDPWRVNMEIQDLPKVSPWRAWVEIANAGGRTKELADELLSDLTGRQTWK